MSKYGNREDYDMALRLIAEDKWRVDPIAGTITSNQGRWRGDVIGSPRDGYIRVAVPSRASNGFSNISAHRVIWEFVNGVSDLDLTINHADGDTLNNSIQNLELITNQANATHAHRVLGKANGPRNTGAKNPMAVLDEDTVRDIKRCIARNERGKDIAEKFNVSKTTVSNIKRGVTWSHVGI